LLVVVLKSRQDAKIVASAREKHPADLNNMEEHSKIPQNPSVSDSGDYFMRRLCVATLIVSGIISGIIDGSSLNAQESNLVYPTTRTVEQTDDFHGTNVPDPYRWLEDDVRTSKEVADWVTEQNKVTFGYLKSIPQREIYSEANDGTLELRKDRSAIQARWTLLLLSQRRTAESERAVSAGNA
jgi:hypothetical protein